jgi:uncharacterized membrane protein HdeD (DUF308 family)
LADVLDKGLKKAGISVSRPILAVICIIFGILLLVFPDLVGYIIGIFLIIQGILLVVDYMDTKRQQTPPTRPYTPYTEPSETPPVAPPTENT